MPEYPDQEPTPYAGLIVKGIGAVASKFLYSPAATVVLLLGIALNLDSGHLGTATTLAAILALQAVMTYTDREPLTWFLEKVTPSTADEDVNVELTQLDYITVIGMWIFPGVITAIGGPYGSLIGFCVIFVECAVFARLLARRASRETEEEHI